MRGIPKRTLVALATSVLRHFPATRRLSGAGHILAFHRVVPAGSMSPYGMSAFEVTPETLELILRFFLARGYTFVSLDQLRDRLLDHALPESPPMLAVTFDDGYRDTHECAYPVLQRYAVPFTLAVTVGYAERTTPKWDYLAEDIVTRHDRVVLETEAGDRVLDCSNAVSKARSVAELQEHLYGLNDASGADALERLLARYVKDPLVKTAELMLGWSEIEALARDPLVEIAAHSLNHYVLRRLPQSVAEAEILGAKDRIEARLDRPVRHFCYPYGGPREVSQRELNLVREHFETGTTGTKGNLFAENAEHLEALPRFSIGSNCDRAYLETIANGSLPLLANWFNRLATQ